MPAMTMPAMAPLDFAGLLEWLDWAVAVLGMCTMLMLGSRWARVDPDMVLDDDDNDDDDDDVDDVSADDWDDDGAENWADDGAAELGGMILMLGSRLD
jgi:hypothetical protein